MEKPPAVPVVPKSFSYEKEKMFSFDCTLFHIIRIRYTVDGTDYIKKQWIGAGKPVPSIGSPVRLSYDEEKPSKAKVL